MVMSSDRQAEWDCVRAVAVKEQHGICAGCWDSRGPQEASEALPRSAPPPLLDFSIYLVLHLCTETDSE